MNRKPEPKHPITQWDESAGLLATEKGRARAMLLPDDVVLLAKAADREFHIRQHTGIMDFTHSYDVDPAAHFAKRSVYRESEGFTDAIHDRIRFLNFEHPDHARHHAEYMAYMEPQTELSNAQHRRDWTVSYCEHCPGNAFAMNRVLVLRKPATIGD